MRFCRVAEEEMDDDDALIEVLLAISELLLLLLLLPRVWPVEACGFLLADFESSATVRAGVSLFPLRWWRGRK